MNRQIRKRMILAGWILALAGFAAAEPVDPRFPEERDPAEVVSQKPMTWWPRSRIQQLEEERDQLLQKIKKLPQHDPQHLHIRIGYHSPFEDHAFDRPNPPQQLEFSLQYPQRLAAIALVPAFDPQDDEGGSYAFPVRFKIEVRSKEGARFKEVVNWMEEDFPDPGCYPVFFSDIDMHARDVRITVAQQPRASGAAYFALGEVYLFRQRSDGSLGSNMALWSRRTTEASDSFTRAPLWSFGYVHDGVAGLGFPLTNETVVSPDLLIVPMEGPPLADPVQLVMDLGQVKEIGPIDIWPAKAPHSLALSSYGFPQKVSIEASPTADFKEAKVLAKDRNSIWMHRGRLLSFYGQRFFARYIRVTMEGLREHRGRRILGLGEIQVTSSDVVASIDCEIAAQGIPEQYLDQLPRLVDGYSRHRSILSRGEWIKGLAKRRPLDRQLAAVELELKQARKSWGGMQRFSWISGGAVVGMVLLGGLVVQRWHRRQSMIALKRRITRDLHDEVGSSLGSISLTAEQLERTAPDAGLKKNLGELSLMTREACASLREVVWVIDEGTIRLPAQARKLIERAERVLIDVELATEISPDCPDVVVSMTVKRHLNMFFKEAVHNCARHARATRVQIAVSTTDEYLQVAITDDGCGFDPSKPSEGWGLSSMKKRAQEIGGEAELNSRPGEGTTILLKMPLAALAKEPGGIYHSSN